MTNILVVKWRKNKVYAALVVDDGDASMLEDSSPSLLLPNEKEMEMEIRARWEEQKEEGERRMTLGS